MQKLQRLRLSAGILLAFGALLMTLLSGVAMASGFNNGGNFTNGQTVYTNQACGSCHGAPPSGAPYDNLPGANEVAVLNNAITNNLGGQMGAFSGLTAQQRLDVTRYIGNYTAPNVSNSSSNAVAYNSAGTSIDLNNFIDTCSDEASCEGTPGPNGTITSLQVVSGPAHGTITSANPTTGTTFTYKPNAGYIGTDSFTYRANGVDGNSGNATVTVQVSAPPAPSLGTVPTQTVNYTNPATALPIDLSSYISNPYTTVTVTTPPSKGGTSVSGAVITYTPTIPKFGSDSFGVTIVGPGGSTTGTINVSINTPTPTDSNGSRSIAYNTPTTVDLSLLVSPYVPGGTTFAIDQQPADATTALTISGTSVTYTPSATFYGGTDSFKYHATNPGNPAGSSATFTFTVGQPPAPVVGASTATVAFQSTGNSLPLNVTNPYNAVTITSAATHGTASVSGTSILYSPAAGYTGTDSVSYTATSPDGTVSSASGTITITVSAGTTPVANSASLAASYNTPLTIDMSTIITGPAQGITVTVNPAHGTLMVTGLSVKYTQTANYTGADSFTYTAVGYPSSNTSTGSGVITITTAQPGAPVSSNVGPVAIGYNAAATAIPLAGSITGAGPIMVTVGTAAHGTATISGTTASYKPATNYYGADSFTYQASNPGGAGNTATVSVTVANPPPPTAAANTMSIPYNGNATLDLTSSVSGVLNTTPPPLSIGTAPLHGTAVFTGNVVKYTSTLGYFGSDSFTYIATGPGGSSAPATVTVSIATPSAPVAGANTLAVPYGASASIDLTQKVTGVFTSVALASQPTHGSVSLSGNLATYTPNNLYYGSDSFTYTATGPGGQSAAGTISVTVGLPPMPTVQSTAVNVTYNTAQTVALGADVMGVYSSLAIATQPTHGTASLSGSTLTYTPTSGYYGPDSLTYTATGPGGTSSPATVSLTVVRPNAPVAVAAAISDDYNKPATIDLTSVVQGIATSVAIAAPPVSGTAVASGLHITYTPNNGFFGTDAFTYTVVGPGGTSAPAAISVTVKTAPAHAWNTTLLVTLNSSGKLDLSKWITGSGITGAQIVAPPQHGSATMAGTMLTYTPKQDFFGSDTLTYQAFGALGMSNVGTITITVTGRPDPSQNADVQGVVSSELSAAERFARAQTSNFQSHLQSLHSSSLTEEVDEEHPDDRLHRPVTPGTAPGAATPGYSQATPSSGSLFAASNNSFMPASASTSASPASPGFAGNATTGAQSLPSAASVRSDSVVYTNGNPLASQVGAASMVKAGYFPGTPPSYADNNAVVAQSITSINLGSLAGSMMENQEAASVDHHGLSSLWVLGSVNFGERTPGGPTQNFGTDGITFGVDYRLSRQLVFGVGAGYGTDRTTIGTDGTHTRSTGVDVAIYGSYAPTDRSFVDAVIGVGSLDFDATRTVAAINSAATSHRSGDQEFASISAGYDWSKGGAHVQPYVRLDASQNNLHGMTETGAGEYDLSYSKQDQNSVAAAVGLRLEATQSFDYGVARPHATIEYEHEFDGNQSLNLNYASFAGTSYSITPSVLDRNTLAVGFGADYLMRHGLSVGWDYQVLHASGMENSQTIRFKVSQDLDQNFVLPLVSLNPLVNVRGDLGYTYDDNVTRSVDKLADQSWSLGLSRVFATQLNDNTRISLEPSLGFEKFETYVGLSHADAGLKAELQYRESGDFSSPIYSIFTKLSGSNYETTLRDGERLQLGLSGYLPVTDRINAFAAVGVDGRHASSAVFNGTSAFVRLNLDYALSATGTLYAGGEFRAGDLVSSGFESLDNLDAAKIYVVDDAFPHSGRIAYRFTGQTGIGTLGYNFGLSSTSSVDLSYRIILATPNYQPEYDSPTIRYVDHQLGLVYLVRF